MFEAGYLTFEVMRMFVDSPFADLLIRLFASSLIYGIIWDNSWDNDRKSQVS